VRTPDLTKRCKFSRDETLGTAPLSALYLSRVAEGFESNGRGRPHVTVSPTVFAAKQSASIRQPSHLLGSQKSLQPILHMMMHLRMAHYEQAIIHSVCNAGLMLSCRNDKTPASSWQQSRGETWVHLLVPASLHPLVRDIRSVWCRWHWPETEY
jgi:hypothetical protein